VKLVSNKKVWDIPKSLHKVEWVAQSVRNPQMAGAAACNPSSPLCPAWLLVTYCLLVLVHPRSSSRCLPTSLSTPICPGSPLTSSLHCLGHAPGHGNNTSHLPRGALLWTQPNCWAEQNHTELSTFYLANPNLVKWGETLWELGCHWVVPELMLPSYVPWCWELGIRGCTNMQCPKQVNVWYIVTEMA